MDSNSQKALYPEEYFAQVALATDEFTSEEKVSHFSAEKGPFMDSTGSGIDCSLNRFAPVYLSKR
jgi:hypothetical protein